MRLVLLLVPLLLLPSVEAWDQFKGSADHSLIAPSNVFVNGTLRWKYITGAEIQGSVAVVDDTTFAPSTDGKVYSIARNGQLNWAYDAKSPVWTSVSYDEGKVLFVDESGILHALDIDGVELWEYDCREKVYHSSPAVDSSGNIYFGTGTTGTLVCVKPDGKMRWKYHAGEFIESTPAIGKDGTVYAASGDGTVHAVGQMGRAKWDPPFKAKGSISSSVCISGDGTILFGCEDGYLYRLGSDGTLNSKVNVGKVHLSSPATVGNRAYVGTMGGDMVCVEGSKVIWRYPTRHAIECSPIVTDEGSIIFGSTDGWLYSLNESGKLEWRFRSSGYFSSSSPGFADDGTLVVGCGDGAVYSFGRPYPASPANLLTVPGNGMVRLNWTYPRNETVEFRVYRSTDGKSFTEIGSTRSKVYSDTGLRNGQEYTYKVTAVSEVGEGPFSAAASEIPNPDLPPTETIKDDQGPSPLQVFLLIVLILAVAAFIVLLRRGRGEAR